MTPEKALERFNQWFQATHFYPPDLTLASHLDQLRGFMGALKIPLSEIFKK